MKCKHSCRRTWGAIAVYFRKGALPSLGYAGAETTLHASRSIGCLLAMVRDPRLRSSLLRERI